MDKSVEKRAGFLQQASSSLSSENRVHRLLKSYYLSRKISAAGSMLSSQKHLNEESVGCSQCLSKWSDVQYNIHIRPAKLRLTAAKNLVNNKSVLSKSERILANKYRKSINPIAEITCNVCASSKNIPIRMKTNSVPKNIQIISAESKNDHITQNIIDLTALKLVQPQKRHRDKNAGLKSFNSATKTPEAPAPPKVVSSTLPGPNTSKKNKQRPGNSKMTKGSNKKKAKTSANNDSKQRSNILLLANVLKMKSNHSSSSNLHRMLRE